MIIVDEFTTVQVAQLSGFSARQLDYWASGGMLVPSVKASSGPGTRKLYSFDDLVKLSFIRQLKQAGWSTQKIRKALEQLNNLTTESPNYRNITFVYDKKTILILCETQERQQILLDALNPGGQQVLWIVLELLRAETLKNAIQLLNTPDADNRQLDIAM